jgi:hypothetical protein
LRALEQLRLVEATQRRKIAAIVYAEIKPLVGSSDIDALRRAAQVAQDERWRLISAGTRDMTDVRFASTVLAEQWLLAQAELIRSAAPVAEVLAAKRSDGIERFIHDHLSFEDGEVIHLHALASLRRESTRQLVKNGSIGAAA